MDSRPVQRVSRLLFKFISKNALQIKTDWLYLLYNLNENKMREDFRPTMTQMNYFDVDLSTTMKEQGIIRDDEETMVRNIEWYNWDNDPRWFVHVMLFNERGERRGYVEVDVWVDVGNGPDNPMGILEVKLAGHGYPCISTVVAQWDKETDDWIIEGEED